MSIVLDNMLKTLSTTQAAEYFGVHLKTIFRWINSGKLTAEKINGQWHVQIDEHDAQNDVQNAQGKTQDNVQSDVLERLIHQQQAEIYHLRDQLARRDEHIESLTQEIDHLTQLLAVQTKTNASLTDRLQMIEDMRQRRTVWQRFRALFVTESGSG